MLTVASGDGARVVVHTNGAHVTSWIPAGSEVDRLFVSARSGFGPGVSIRGGIPVIFPQFGAEGSLPRHGFARTLPWTVVNVREGADAADITLQLEANEQTRAVWPFAFRAQLVVTVRAQTLEVRLSVENTDTRELSFTAALHPYFTMTNAYHATVTGLQGCDYRDALRDRQVSRELPSSLAIHGEIDRVYFDVIGALEVSDGDRLLRVEKRGFPDAVVWNPGESGTAGRADFEPGDEHRMLCVEAAAVQRPVVLALGARWEGVQIMTAVR